MTSPHAPRATDLVALVSFDGDVYENQAVTRDRLGRAQGAPHALSAALQHWLGIGRRVWVDVRGRQIQGIATARDMATRDAWEIDTLVDAGDIGAGDVIGGLLRQATEAASEAGVGRLLLRTQADTPTIAAAIQAGFSRALDERLWIRAAEAVLPPCTSNATVQDATDADAILEFQLYNRSLPSDARRLLGMTFDEWSASRDRRWTGRGGRTYVVNDNGRASGSLQVGAGQFALLTEPGDDAVAEALLAKAVSDLDDTDRILALLPDCAATASGMLHAFGFQPTETYTLLALRVATPIRADAKNLLRAAGRVVPSGS